MYGLWYHTTNGAMKDLGYNGKFDDLLLDFELEIWCEEDSSNEKKEDTLEIDLKAGV